MPRRKPDTWSAGERAENRARAEAKKPITNKHSKFEAFLNAKLEPITAEQHASVMRLVQRMARGDDDRAELLDELGLSS